MCCGLSGRGLCVGLIFRPEDSSECGVYNERDRKAVRGLCAVKKGSRFLQKLI